MYTSLSNDAVQSVYFFSLQWGLTKPCFGAKAYILQLQNLSLHVEENLHNRHN